MGNSRFSMQAYTGTVIDFDWLGRVVFDLAGMRLTLPAPALREHSRDRAAGVIDRSNKTPDCLTAEGYFVSTPDGREIRALILEGFPYQASVGVWPENLEEVKAGESAKVNGGVFEGPGLIVRQSFVREISFVSLGADPETSVAALAAGSAQRSNPMEAPQDFNGALLLMLRRGHRVEVALVEARREFPKLYEAYCLFNLPGQQESGALRPDEAVTAAARELASSAGIPLDVATGRILNERPDLAGPYWQAFQYKS